MASFRITASISVPRIAMLKKTFGPKGRRDILEAIAESFYQEVMSNFETEGGKRWAKWRALRDSTVYAKSIRGRGGLMALEGFKKKVKKSIGENTVSVFIPGKLAKYHHEGRGFYAGKGTRWTITGNPLWFPLPGGRYVRSDGSTWFKGQQVRSKGYPARRMVPDHKTAYGLARKVVDEFLAWGAM